jgi:penicillin-binding protein 1B
MSTSRNVYSARRFRLVLALLTLFTLPLVFGAAAVVFYYLKYSAIVEGRLSGERWIVPSRLYSRSLTLRPGLPMTQARLLKTLNGLKYEQRAVETGGPGQFALRQAGVVVELRPGIDTSGEPVLVVFDKERIRELRGLRSKRLYATQTLEPELVTYLFDESREKRRFVTYEELPETLVHAVLAIEDRRFFSHPGLDPFRLAGAIVRNIRSDSETPHGASTITQQLVKNFFLTPERTLRRKVQEAFIAFILERRAAKKEILELYLNEIYLGQAGSFSINGMGEAARVYFHKDVQNLTLAEAALLAGMIQSPNPYNPQRHPQRATERRNAVLRAMQDAAFVDAQTAQAAMQEPISVEKRPIDAGEAPYFVDLVKAQLAQRYPGLVTQNLSIYTSLDPNLQAVAQEALASGLAQVDTLIKRKDKPGPVQGALIALEPSSGAILALVGGRSYGQSQYNRAIAARRQPGSTFKPFVYLTAFEAVFEDPALPPITPATVVEDVPSVFFFEDKEYIPQNYEDEYLGLVTLRRALVRSLNVATVKVAEMVGYSRVAEMWSSRLGIAQNIKPFPALALGSFEATPLEMATAYNVLANGGLKVDPVTVLRITDEKGQLVERYQPKPPSRAVHEESAFLVVNMMRSVFNEGTAAGARGMGFDLDAAGKTGTTNDMRDAWFAGFTPDLLCVVWVGFDDNTPINLQGSRAALPIWVDFMKKALLGTEPKQFPVPPENVVFVEIDKQTGLLATPNCPKTMEESFIAGTEPHERCRMH